MACGKLIGAVDHVLALTGTIIGGYANHLYPLLMRISPETLRDEGFEWGKDLAFSEVVRPDRPDRHDQGAGRRAPASSAATSSRCGGPRAATGPSGRRSGRASCPRCSAGT